MKIRVSQLRRLIREEVNLKQRLAGLQKELEHKKRELGRNVSPDDHRDIRMREEMIKDLEMQIQMRSVSRL